MFIEIKGVQFSNKGAELMLKSIDNKLKSELDAPYSLVLSPRNSPFDERLNYQAYQKIGNLFKRIDWSYLDFLVPDTLCKNYGLKRHKDVNIVLDASGFAYGQQWNPAMLKHSVRQARKLHLDGGKYIFLPQAMGPFENSIYSKLIKQAVRYSELFFVRDKKSYEYVTKITGEVDKVQIFPDFTNLLNVDDFDDNIPRLSRKKIVTFIPNNKMINTKRSSLKWENYVAQFIDAALWAQKQNFHVCVMNHEGRNDELLCSQIYSGISSKNATLISGVNAIQIKKIINKSHLVVSSRFHGCVSSLSQGIPVVGTSWSHKYEMLYEDYDVQELIYKFDSSLSSLLSNILLNYDEYKNRLNKSLELEKLKSQKMWDIVFSRIKGD